LHKMEITASSMQVYKEIEDRLKAVPESIKKNICHVSARVMGGLNITIEQFNPKINAMVYGIVRDIEYSNDEGLVIGTDVDGNRWEWKAKYGKNITAARVAIFQAPKE